MHSIEQQKSIDAEPFDFLLVYLMECMHRCYMCTAAYLGVQCVSVYHSTCGSNELLSSHCHCIWDKKLSCRRETARCFASMNMSLSHSRSFEIASIDRSHTSSYWRSTIMMTLSCIISEIKRENLVKNWDFFHTPPAFDAPVREVAVGISL